MAKKRKTTGPNYADIHAWIRAQPAEDRAELRRSVREIQNLFRAEDTNDIWWWHEVGEHVLEIFPYGDRQYGSSVIDLLANKLDPGRAPDQTRLPNLLHGARHIAAEFTAEELKELTGKRNAAGQELGVAHIKALLSVKKKRDRKRLLNRCLKESWGTRRLWEEIQNTVGHKRTHGGRPPQRRRVPKPGVALRDISRVAADWLRYDGVWFSNEGAAFAEDCKLPSGQETHNNLNEAIENLQKVRDAADDGIKTLTKIEKEICKTTGSRGRRKRTK
jgi:hypothetical protein